MHEALAAVRECCECEGILPALESAHALAGARALGREHPGGTILIGLSGRGDKDMPTLQQTLLRRSERTPCRDAARERISAAHPSRARRAAASRRWWPI